MMVSLSACSGSKDASNGGLVRLDGAAPPDLAAAASTFTVFDIQGCGVAGYQTTAASSAAGGGKVGFATLAETGKQAPCALEGRPASTAPVFDLCVVLSTASGFSASVVTSQPYVAKMGVGLAFDKTGEPVLAYTGGPSAAQRCGASDMMVASASGGKLGASRTIAAGSQSSGLVPALAANCAAQDVCNQGDATGYWPSIALNPVTGALGVAFRDLHFGFATTDYANSDVEVALGDAYAVYTVDVARGGGSYNRLAYSPKGKAAVAHYSLDNNPAVWIDWESDQGWSSQKLFTGKIREQLGFGISGQGLYAVAYFDEVRKQLAYQESADGGSWTSPEDLAANGYYPSLAFDEQGAPAIAFYYCGGADSSGGCDMTKDGLYLARRRDGSWDIRKISGDAGMFDGLYPALAFLNGKAVIAYQTNEHDPLSGASKVSLHIAQEM